MKSNSKCISIWNKRNYILSFVNKYWDKRYDKYIPTNIEISDSESENEEDIDDYFSS